MATTDDVRDKTATRYGLRQAVLRRLLPLLLPTERYLHQCLEQLLYQSCAAAGRAITVRALSVTCSH